MGRLIKNGCLIFTAASIITALLAVNSCANTTAPPSGGAKDTLAPILLKVMPDSNKLNFQRYGQRIEMAFNEYVILKEPEKNIVVSPPLNKSVVTKVRGKRVITQFPDSLKSETTYSISYNNSIVDNNEGNIFPPYRFVFSTGNTIDSLLATVNIVDAATLLPIPNATVAFYEEHSDSVLLNHLPSAVAKSDKWGHSIITNLKSIPYRVIAFTDDNGNNRYDPDNEKLAFLDTLFTPSKVMLKDMDELKFIDPEDTTASLARVVDFRLYLFKEETNKQYLKKHERLSDRLCYLKFNAPDVIIDSLKFKELDTNMVIQQFNIKRDSLTLWIKGDAKRIPDTLNLSLNFHKSDSLERLVPVKEALRFIIPKKAAKQEGQSGPEKRANLLDLKIDDNPALIEKDGYKLQFDAPIDSVKTDKISFISLTTKGAKKAEEFRIYMDSTNIRQYMVEPKIKLLHGYDYILTVKQGAFKDISANVNDSLEVKTTLPKGDQLAHLTLEVEGSDESSYVVELINQSRDKVFRSYKISNDSSLSFPYLEAGKYSIRIFRDSNNNGILDSGNLKERRQPEMVRLYKIPSGSEVINLGQGMELVQRVNLNEIFK